MAIYGASPTAVGSVAGDLSVEPEQDGLYDFDQLPLEHQRGAIVDMLNAIPKVTTTAT